MQNQSQISICIPAYQAGRFVATALDSALGQTLAAREIIVSDNWATDGTADVLERYRGQVRITRPETHLSMSDHYWYLTQCASGDYVVWLDADNALHHRFIETVTPFLGRYAMVATGRFECDSTLRPRGYSGLGYLNHQSSAPGELFEHFLQGCRHSHSGTAWSREWLLSLPRPPKEAEYVTDWYLGIATAARHSIAMLPPPRHYYRFHDSNASHSEPDRWRRSALAMLNWLASTEVLEPIARATVRERAERLAAEPPDSSSKTTPAHTNWKAQARAVASYVAAHAYRHPAYLR